MSFVNEAPELPLTLVKLKLWHQNGSKIKPLERDENKIQEKKKKKQETNPRIQFLFKTTLFRDGLPTECMYQKQLNRMGLTLQSSTKVVGVLAGCMNIFE